jgi:hypothetical protein
MDMWLQSARWCQFGIDTSVAYRPQQWAPILVIVFMDNHDDHHDQHVQRVFHELYWLAFVRLWQRLLIWLEYDWRNQCVDVLLSCVWSDQQCLSCSSYSCTAWFGRQGSYAGRQGACLRYMAALAPKVWSFGPGPGGSTERLRAMLRWKRVTMQVLSWCCCYNVIV